MPVIITPNGLTPPVPSSKIAPDDGDFVDGASIQQTVQPIWNEIAAVEQGNKHCSALDVGFLGATSGSIVDLTILNDLTVNRDTIISRNLSVGGAGGVTSSWDVGGAGSYGGALSCLGFTCAGVACSGNGSFSGSLTVLGVVASGAHFSGVRDSSIYTASDANVTISGSIEYDLIIPVITANRTWKLANGVRTGMTRTIINNSVSRTLSIQDISSNPLADLLSSNPPGSAPSTWRWVQFVWNGALWAIGPAGH